MSVSIYGVKEIRFRRGTHKVHAIPNEEPAIWMDTHTTGGDNIEMTVNIPAMQFIRKMRLILTKMEDCVLKDIHFDMSMAREEEMNVAPTETKAD